MAPISLTLSKKPKQDHEFWTSDEQVSHCSDCLVRFTVVTRRHHCRCCGEIYCGKCSSQTALVMPATKISKPYNVKEKRVCNGCANIYKTRRLGGVPCEYLLGGSVKSNDKMCLRYEDSIGYLFKEGMNGNRRWIHVSEQQSAVHVDCSYCLKPLDAQVSQFCSSSHQRTCHHMMHFTCALQHDSATTTSFRSSSSSKGKHCPCCCTPYDFIKPFRNPYLEQGEDLYDAVLPENGVTYFLVDVKQRTVFRMPTGFTVGKLVR
eukprot:TRINITY_DN5078_c0_g1_i2.p1 TRINITY_DN5078_c0_g1~~TRINITY_DN5078_c0_g1_i2.p1  ORF type:complete len:262 (+),score=32.47 TRINITY_DN5078_c0_g1_i2:46-831(+)